MSHPRSERVYANWLQVGHNKHEVVLEFGQYQQDEPSAYVHTAIVTTPVFAKAFLETVRASIEAYEKEYGEIGTEDLAPVGHTETSAKRKRSGERIVSIDVKSRRPQQGGRPTHKGGRDHETK